MIEGPKELGGAKRLTEQTRAPTIRRRDGNEMRYLVLLSVLGRQWEEMMRVEGVEESTIESWALYYAELCKEAGSCSPAEMYRAAGRIARAVRTAMWYIRKAKE